MLTADNIYYIVGYQSRLIDGFVYGIESDNELDSTLYLPKLLEEFRQGKFIQNYKILLFTDYNHAEKYANRLQEEFGCNTNPYIVKEHIPMDGIMYFNADSYFPNNW